jgi:hypothetical protein
MANVGRSKTSDIPKQYFGPITGMLPKIQSSKHNIKVNSRQVLRLGCAGRTAYKSVKKVFTCRMLLECQVKKTLAVRASSWPEVMKMTLITDMSFHILEVAVET